MFNTKLFLSLHIEQSGVCHLDVSQTCEEVCHKDRLRRFEYALFINTYCNIHTVSIIVWLFFLVIANTSCQLFISVWNLTDFWVVKFRNHTVRLWNFAIFVDVTKTQWAHNRAEGSLYCKHHHHHLELTFKMCVSQNYELINYEIFGLIRFVITIGAPICYYECTN